MCEHFTLPYEYQKHLTVAFVVLVRLQVEGSLRCIIGTVKIGKPGDQRPRVPTQGMITKSINAHRQSLDWTLTLDPPNTESILY